MKFTVIIGKAWLRLRQFAGSHPAGRWALAFCQRPAFRPAVGSGLALACGLFLWHSGTGEPWVHASYDYGFLFGIRAVTNNLIVVYLDNQAYNHPYKETPNQKRGQPWSRALHAQLLDRLTADGCKLVVFDIYFDELRDPEGEDALLAAAMKRNGHVVLMAEQHRTENRELLGGEPDKPHPFFVAAANTNWGVAVLDNVEAPIVRKHWPFPSPGPYPSLPWKAAQLAGANLGETKQERWLRYYGVDGAWERLSYPVAFTQATNHFRDAIVFIGNKPSTPAPNHEEDEFEIPYTRWPGGEAVGGVDVLATMFLNLMNDDWLCRPAAGLEACVLLLTALGLGAGLSLVRPSLACLFGLAAALGVTLAGAALPHVTHYWFPWLIVAGGQVPVALAWAWGTRRLRWPAMQATSRRRTAPGVPDAPDYELVGAPFGEGHFGKVWLVRNAVGQWQALKSVYRAKFGNNAGPYETEFKGIQRYKPVSDKHAGLLRVDFVSRHEEEGYFYYVMELGDSLTPGWEKDPKLYQPRDLARVREQAPGHRLPPLECVHIGAKLAETLEFLHREGLTHRDIKPGNVVFVKGQPKLADVGLVGDARPPEQVTTWAGTPGYMPPPPEPPGTIVADIYGLGMLLYVISTGNRPGSFPELKTVLMDDTQTPQFLRLNRVILKACNSKPDERYPTAAAMRQALLDIELPGQHNSFP